MVVWWDISTHQLESQDSDHQDWRMLAGAHSLSETLTYCIGNGSKGGLTRRHSLGCVSPSGHQRRGVACDWEPRLMGTTGCRHLQDNEDRRHCAGSWAVPTVRFCASRLGHPL